MRGWFPRPICFGKVTRCQKYYLVVVSEILSTKCLPNRKIWWNFGGTLAEFRRPAGGRGEQTLPRWGKNGRWQAPNYARVGRARLAANIVEKVGVNLPCSMLQKLAYQFPFGGKFNLVGDSNTWRQYFRDIILYRCRRFSKMYSGEVSYRLEPWITTSTVYWHV